MATYDIAVFRPTTSGTYSQEIAASDYIGSTVTGTSKLAQRVIIELFTQKGSYFLRPDRGTDVYRILIQNRHTNEFDMFVALSAAVNEAITNIRAEESDTDPDNERLGTIKINQVALADDTVVLNISVTSLALSTTTISYKLDLDFGGI